MFELLTSGSAGRKGLLKTAHGDIPTPFFMPIATKAAVKTLSSADIERLGSPIILSNAYHLMLRPGIEVIKEHGGLHRFMDWKGAILTDSGGFQVLSLAKHRKVTEEGVEFRSPIDGSKHLLTPERSMEIQLQLGSDVIMCFDELIALPASDEEVRAAVDRTERWAKRCKDYVDLHVGSSVNPKAKLFGIVQGGTNPELRRRSVEGLLNIGFDGYAIGGIVAQETFDETIEVLDHLIPLLPEDKPRYFMGGAKPEQIVEYVKRGVDMFDCVLPTRNARHGHIYRFTQGDLSKPDFYEVINITNAQWRGGVEPLITQTRKHANTQTDSFEDELSRYSMGYLHHLFDTEEMLAYRLATILNLRFYLELFTRLRSA